MGEYVAFHDVSWHSSYAVYFFIVGIAAALFFFSFLSWHQEALRPLRERAAYGSFGLLVVAALLLISDLSQPARFLYIMNPAYLQLSSPLAWGGLNIIAFGAVSAAYLFLLRKGAERWAWETHALAAVGSLLALGLPVYTGFDLTVHQSRPIWNTPLMPVLFVALSIASGAAVCSLLVSRNDAALRMLRRYMLWSAGAVGVMLVSLLGTTAYGGAAEELTLQLMLSGGMGLVFIGLGMVAGTAVPIALMLAPFGREHTVLAVSALLLLAGGAALRYALLMGPQIAQTLY